MKKKLTPVNVVGLIVGTGMIVLPIVQNLHDLGSVWLPIAAGFLLDVVSFFDRK